MSRQIEIIYNQVLKSYIIKDAYNDKIRWDFTNANDITTFFNNNEAGKKLKERKNLAILVDAPVEIRKTLEELLSHLNFKAYKIIYKKND